MSKVTVVFDKDVEDWLRGKMRRKGDLSRIVNDVLRKEMRKEKQK